jgi:hypothetical protein
MSNMEGQCMSWLPKNFKWTYTKEKFIQSDCGYNNEDRVVVFTTSNSLNIFERSKIWLADGTFRSAPSGFLHVYTIHGMYFEKKRVTLVYAFMKRKKEKSCNILFNWVLENIRRCGNFDN